MHKLTVVAFLGMILIFAPLAPSAIAQQQKFTVNPAASNVTFQLGGNTHAVHGTFHVKSGVVNFDRETRKISGLIVVDPLSGDSGSSGRDQKMKNEVLEVGRFAEITFEPKSFAGDLAANGDSTIQVTGIFTLHGTAHDLTIPMQIHVEGNQLTAKTHFTVPYVQWGLKDPSIFVLKVAKEVGIDLKLEGQL
ncbi:YceI family protein [Telmatobacter bradus]|uniref:YceI family protein n=1 Tax=Telmatobacter bradus TaxID=474953 RepID=UPI003B4300A5